MYVCTDVGFSSTSKGKPSLSNENAMTNFRHYYVLRIFQYINVQLMKIQINLCIGIPHTNLCIPGFAKPSIVAEICPSGFVHSSYLPSDWLTLV